MPAIKHKNLIISAVTWLTFDFPSWSLQPNTTTRSSPSDVYYHRDVYFYSYRKFYWILFWPWLQYLWTKKKPTNKPEKIEKRSRKITIQNIEEKQKKVWEKPWSYYTHRHICTQIQAIYWISDNWSKNVTHLAMHNFFFVMWCSKKKVMVSCPCSWICRKLKVKMYAMMPRLEMCVNAYHSKERFVRDINKKLGI